MSISGGNMPGNCRKLGMKGETLAAATTAAIWLLACSVGDCAAAGGRLFPAAAAAAAAALMPATPTDADTDVSFASLSVADDVVVECFLLALFEPPPMPPLLLPPLTLLPTLQLTALLVDLAPRSVPPALELAAGRLTPPLPPPPPPVLLLPLLS